MGMPEPDSDVFGIDVLSQGLLTQAGARRAARPPWPGDSLEFLPISHWMHIRTWIS
jgi:hypothetical protein